MAAPVTVPFAHSERSTVGIEWEVALVDADSGDLRQAAEAILDAVRPADGGEHPLITPGAAAQHRRDPSRASAARSPRPTADLQRALDEVEAVTTPCASSSWAARTHPFANWAQQKVTDKQRYATLIDRTQWWGRQMLIYGVHVHVGIEDRDKVLPIVPRDAHGASRTSSRCRRRRPFWGGKDTGYASNRALMFQQLPTAGLPFEFEDWSQLEQYVGDMMHTGVIDQFDEVRWDVRPSPRFGTLEMRIADGASNLLEVAAISALTHCFVEHFSSMLDRGETLPTLPPWFAQENKWRSARYGMDAIIITNAAGDEELVTDAVGRWLVELAPVAERLGCAAELEQVRVILRRGASYQRQRAVARRHAGELDAVVRSLVAELKAGRPL